MLIIALFSFFYWFFLSIPVGAIQIEIARRAFNGYLKSAIAIIIGSVVSDFIYGIVALMGVFQFLAIPRIRPFFWLFGAILLAILGILAIRNYYHPHEITHSTTILTKKRYSLMTGFLVAASNPLIIIGWITGAEVARRIGVMQYSGFYNLVVFIVAGTLGLGVYLLMIALILYRLRHFLSERVIRITSFIFGLVLIGLGTYFLIEAILELSGYHSSFPMNGSNPVFHSLTNL